MSSTLGKKLRECRKQASLTLKEVADEAGFSTGFISQVERDISVPSLSSLRAIAGVLGQPISVFLEQPSSADATRATERVSFRVGDGALSYERISARFAGSTLRSVVVHEPPGHRNEPVSHEGEELFFILDGELTVEVEGVPTVLTRGDSTHFDSRKVHSTWNHTSQTASLLWCGTMDVFGEDAIEPVHKTKKKRGG
ncbi:MAG: cupin domain-containing protein [Paracoccaceae bacterium]